MNDRAVQDDIIRYLADAKQRARGTPGVPIAAAEAHKADHFAKFLARRYYRDRLARSFRYSHRFHISTGRTAVEIADSEAFEEFLRDCVMGSLESARRVAQMSRVHLSTVAHPGPWWPDLLEYECAYFLQAATSERQPPSDRPSARLSAICRHFAWDLPQALPRLRAGETVGNELQREVTLLFSRTDTGRVYVVELEPAAERVFLATDGQRTLSEIAARAQLDFEQSRQILEALAGIGAISQPS